MSIIGPMLPADRNPGATAEIEGKLRELVQKESSRQTLDIDSEIGARSISSTVKRIAGTSVAQIDRLIVDLTQLRDHLRNQGEHVQTEIARVDAEIASYARANQTAAKSIDAIGQSLVRFHRATGPSQAPSQAETEKN